MIDDESEVELSIYSSNKTGVMKSDRPEHDVFETPSKPQFDPKMPFKSLEDSARELLPSDEAPVAAQSLKDDNSAEIQVTRTVTEPS